MLRASRSLVFSGNGADHGRLAVLLAFVCAAAAPLSLRAQVLEIDPLGGVTRHEGPSVTTSDGETPIPKPVRIRSAHPASASGPVDRLGFTRAGTASDLSPDLLAAVAWRESAFKNQAVSSAGALGQMQLMPRTARDLRVDPRDPRQNLRGGAVYLKALLNRYHGDLERALAAYNAGPATVDRYRGVPPIRETQAYVGAVLSRLSDIAEGRVVSLEAANRETGAPAASRMMTMETGAGTK
jgi:hypothetical protein